MKQALLKNIAEIRTGYNFRSISNARLREVFLISAKDLNSNFKNLDTISIPFSYESFLRDGDILVKSRGSVYEAKVFRDRGISKPCVAANTLIVARVKDEEYLSSYITQIINSEGVQKYLRSLSLGQTVPTLSPASLGTLMCPMIPQERQKQIEVISETIEDYQITMTRYLEASEKLSKTLKTKLMKGAI